MNLLFIIIGLFVLWLIFPSKKKTRSYKQDYTWQDEKHITDKVDYSLDEDTLDKTARYNKQLEIVCSNEFFTKKLMNKGEFKLFKNLDSFIKEEYPSFRLFPQVSMGEFLRSTEANAYYAINSKRVDFLIIDPYGEPKVVVEYQGAGHYQQNSEERDLIKNCL